MYTYITVQETWQFDAFKLHWSYINLWGSRKYRVNLIEIFPELIWQSNCTNHIITEMLLLFTNKCIDFRESYFEQTQKGSSQSSWPFHLSYTNYCIWVPNHLKTYFDGIFVCIILLEEKKWENVLGLKCSSIWRRKYLLLLKILLVIIPCQFQVQRIPVAIEIFYRITFNL